MNKNFYRLVYCKTRSMLVAVAEFARAHRSGSAVAGKAASGQAFCKLNAVSFGIMLALGAVQPAQANIAADGGAPAGQQPTIIANPGMATQIDIHAPSAAGVSRNSYSQFDVDRNGAVLNNSQHGAMTQLAGEIAGNQALVQGAAKIILNEVNSANPSQLNGMIEVAGQQAQVIITNPSGISCDGCGFINTSRATLSTGQAQLENGALTGYKVEGGEIVVQGVGMNSSASYTDIIARAVKVNSALHADELKITTGRNHVDAANEQITALEDKTDARPELALDVSSMGGMYAGKITLVGTEKGVGVNNAGIIYTQAGSVTLNADGSITNSGVIDSSNGVTLIGNNVINEQQAAILSGGDTEIFAANSVNNTGMVQSQKSLGLTANSLNNSGDINAGENINISAKSQVSNEHALTAGKNITIAAASYSGGQASALQAGNWSEHGDIKLNTSDKISAAGRVQASGDWLAEAENIDLGASQIQANNIDLKASADLNLEGTELMAGQQLKLQGNHIAAQDGNLSGDRILIAAKSFTHSQGQIFANNIAIDAASVHNNQGSINSSGDLTINSGYLSNQGGTLYAENALLLTSDSLLNDEGLIAGQQLVDLSVGNLTNNDGNISGFGDITINSSGTVFNNGNINAGQALIVASQDDITNTGSLYGDRKLALTAKNIVNAGALTANGDIIIEAATLDSKTESVISAGEWGSGNLKITTSGSLIAKGTNSANGTLQLKGERVDLSGSFTQAESIFVEAEKMLTTSNACVRANEGIHLKGKEISNQFGSLSANRINITAEILDNQQGAINAYGDIQLAVEKTDNSEGTITVAGREIESIDDSLPQQEESGEYLLPNLEVTGNEWASGPALDALKEIKAAMGVNQIGWRPGEEALRNVVNYLYVALESGYEIDDQMVNALARLAMGASWTEEGNAAMASIASLVKMHWQQAKITPPANEETVTPPMDEEEAVTPPMDEEEAVTPPADEEEIVTPPADEEEIVTPPADEEEIVTPPADEEEAVTPPADEEEIVTPPMDEEEAVTPPADKEEAVTLPADEEEAVTPTADEDEIVTPSEDDNPPAKNDNSSSLPDLNVTGDEMYREWGSYASVLSQVKSAKLDWNTPAGSKMLEHVINYMYVALENGYGLDEQMVKALAQQAWGLGATQENIAATAQVAAIVNAAWQAGK
ncbi:filamentous hemagglutinin N-terminal domain-containing protein [Kalamiella sp. sgz302252]|uniref:two-partner secretion domain-containing protein n=1 Tax=Pantoea sp. sgz302252 TaxID=3341827 RepID=UPI0036D3AE6F